MALALRNVCSRTFPHTRASPLTSKLQKNSSSVRSSTPNKALLNSTSRAYPLFHHNTMATDAASAEPKKFEWLVVVPDFPGAHEKRLEVRPQHFANLGPAKESGLFQMGGAVLNSVPTSDDPKTFDFAGSMIVMVASSREEVKKVLSEDVYAKTGVWDVENAQIWPLLCAFRNQK